MTADSPKLSILLPVRNEGVNLRIMLRMLRALLEVSHEVLVVHDTPEDDSLEVVDEINAGVLPAPGGPGLRAVYNDRGPGVINAIKAGVAAARGELVLIFAADEVGPVLAIDDMIALMDAGCDLVSCTRYAHGGRRLGGSLLGGLLSRLANRLFHALTGSRLTDATTGVKLFRRARFAELGLEARPVGWAVAFEMSIKAQLLGWRLGEVPIVSIDRLYGGKSTFRPWPWIREYVRWFVWGMRQLQSRRWTTAPVQIRVPATCALGGRPT